VGWIRLRRPWFYGLTAAAVVSASLTVPTVASAAPADTPAVVPGAVSQVGPVAPVDSFLPAGLRRCPDVAGKESSSAASCGTSQFLASGSVSTGQGRDRCEVVATPVRESGQEGCQLGATAAAASASGSNGPRGANSAVPAFLADPTSYTVTLTYSGTTTLTLTATVNQANGYWLEMFETNANGFSRALGWCNAVTVCQITAAPRTSQSTYIAVLGTTITGGGYADYPAASKVAESSVTPPAWQVSLTASVSTKIQLTATANYLPSAAGAFIQIYETSVGGLNAVASCQTISCTISVVPNSRQSTYLAVVGSSNSGSYASYPASSRFAESNPLTPPSWAVTLSGATSGGTSSLTAVSNYDLTGTPYFIEIFDLTANGNITNIGWCGSGTTCTLGVAASSHRFIATAGTISNTYPPGTVFAVSNQVGTAGQTSAFETTGGSNPAEWGMCYQCRGDPINTSTGEFFETVTDASAAGRGPALTLTRTYSSQRAPYDGPFGPGWSFGYGMALSQNTSTGVVTVTQENGSAVTFTPSGSTYTAGPRVDAALAHNGDGSWTYTRKSRQLFDFTTAGLLSAVRDLNGNARTVSHGTGGQVAAVTDGAGRTLTFTYGTNGRIATVTDPATRQTSYGYDSSGRLSSVTAPGGAVTHYGYDSWNLLTSVTDPTGAVAANGYDAAQRVTSQTDPTGHTTTFAYGADGTTTTTTPAGRVTLDSYTNGQLTTITRGAGTAQAATWTYGYEAATCALTSVTDPNNHTTSYTVDTLGRRTSATDPNNHTQTWTYNTLGEVTAATDANGTTTTTSYDSAGNPLTVSTPLTGTTSTRTTTYTYASSAHPGDITAITDPDGHTTTLGYDTYGNTHTVTDPLTHTTTTDTDVLGRTTAVTTPRGNTTHYGYNTAGHLTTITDPAGHDETRGYDAAGRLTSTTDRLGHTTSCTRDGNGRITTTTRPDTTNTTAGYDLDGNQTSYTDANNHTTSYTYDPLDRLVSSTDPLNRTTNYGYDKAGNRTTLTDPAGRVTTDSYDPANQLTATTYSDGGTPGVAYTYTPAGQQATMTDGTGTTTTSYDSLGRVTDQTNGAGQHVGYGHDLSGHLTTLTYPNGHDVTRGYDTGGRLTTVTDWAGHTTTITPDADGNPATTTDGNGVVQTTTWDTTDQQSGTAITDPGGTTLAALPYTRDHNTQLTGTTPQGLPGTAETYSYDTLNQLVGVNTDSYAYDHAGNTTTLTNGATLTYDAADQPTGYTTTAGTTTITYDPQGNRLTGPAPGGTATYAYDQANHLTTATTSAATSSYTYDATGLRITRTTGSTTQHFAWDVASGVALLLTDGTTNYLYDDTGHPLEQLTTTGTALYYQADQYGSTRLLTDSTGAVAATYTYDAYGTLTGHTGTADTVLRWNGQQQDPDTGLYYLRNRYYDPITTQFLTRDPLATITRALYNYAANDPLNRMDPLGLTWWNPTTWTPETRNIVIGVGLGVLAVATGGAALAVGATAAGFALGATSVGLGMGAAAMDAGPCLNDHAAVACVGLGLGASGSVAGLAGVGGVGAVLAGVIAEDSLASGLLGGIGAFGFQLGLGGTAVDFGAAIGNSDGC
jgi:RHS repeat-associated protein